MRGADGVTFVEGDVPVLPLLDTSHVATRGAEAVRDPIGADGTPLDGSGISIAVIDSGIDGTHPFFTQPDGSSKVVRNVKNVCPFVDTFAQIFTGDFVDECFADVPGNDSDTLSTGGHGTHVAGIAAGNRVTLADGRTVQGAAPGATLVGLSVGQLISVYGGNSGLNWVLENHAAPCGEGVPAAVVPADPRHQQLLRRRRRLRVRPRERSGQAAAGTARRGRAHGLGGRQRRRRRQRRGADHQRPGQRPHARHPHGRQLRRRRHRHARRQPVRLQLARRARQTGTYPDISAPGDGILSACRPYLPICNSCGTLPVNGPAATDLATFNTISGTSMAAPHIAGIVAQLLEGVPGATPAQVEDAIEDGAHRFAAGGAYESDPLNADSPTSFDKGHGLVDVMAAYGDLTRSSSPSPTPTATATSSPTTQPTTQPTSSPTCPAKGGGKGCKG